MRASGLGLCLAAALAIVALLPALAAAGSGYTSAYAGWVSNGTIQSVNGDNVVFAIPNGSGSVHVTVQSTSYTTAEVTIAPGNSYTYWDGLLIAVVQLDSDTGRAYVDIERPTATPTPSPSGTKIYCDTPGQLAMAGDTVTFPLTIVNYDGDHVYALSASNGAGWATSYNFNGKDINQIYVPEGGTRTVNLVVKTAYTSAINTQTITASVDSNTLGVTVQITSVNSSAGLSVKVGTVIASIGGSGSFDLTIDNLQAQDNDYLLSVAGLPQGWYYKFKESAQSTSEMAEAIVPADSSKSLVLQIVPLVSAAQGDYTFTAVVTTPDGVNITKDLTLRLKGSVSMSLAYDKLSYDAQPGTAFNIIVYVTNDGKGEALTNVYADVSAPTGWTVSSSPSGITSIKAGETQAFTVNVVPPGNIVASDYSVEVTVKSDQQQAAETYRITITTSSIVPYVGGGLVLLVVGGLVFMYRKYGRR